MTLRLGINGFGRIGRTVFRIAEHHPDIKVVAINDLTADANLPMLTKYDTVMGRFDSDPTLVDGHLRTAHQSAKVLTERDPSKLPWKDLGVDIAIECTGVFRKRDQVAMHITAGAKKAILCVPSKDKVDATIVIGVNDDALRPEHLVVSNASCTTNCLAPMVKVLDMAFGIKRGLMTTVHAYTNGQALVDVYDTEDFRRGRSAANNVVPSTTGAAKAVGEVLPHLKGKLDGMAVRVPVVDGSLTDLVADWLMPQYVMAAREQLAAVPNGAERWKVLRMTANDLVALRRCDLNAARLALERAKEVT